MDLELNKFQRFDSFPDFFVKPAVIELNMYAITNISRLRIEFGLYSPILKELYTLNIANKGTKWGPFVMFTITMLSNQDFNVLIHQN